MVTRTLFVSSSSPKNTANNTQRCCAQNVSPPTTHHFKAMQTRSSRMAVSDEALSSSSIATAPIRRRIYGGRTRMPILTSHIGSAEQSAARAGRDGRFCNRQIHSMELSCKLSIAFTSLRYDHERFIGISITLA
jgi:hypothetical protein